MKIRRLKILAIALGLSAIASILGIVFYALPKTTLPTMNRIEDFVVVNDAMLRLHDTQFGRLLKLPDYDETNDHLRLLAIDEASLQDPKDGGIGGWPWPRSIYGTILKKLHAAGAKVVAFDVTFPDPAADPSQDAAFAAGLRVQHAVDGYSITTPGGVVNKELPAPAILKNATAVGYTTIDNPGGWMVGQPLVDGDDRSLAAQTVTQYSGKTFAAETQWRAGFGDTSIPLDGTGVFLMLPFQTNEHSDLGADPRTSGGPTARAGSSISSARFFQPFSVVDFLKMSDSDAREFAGGDIVVIGTTAQAMGDFVVTPNGRYPGVFSNLRIMDQLMTGHYVHRAPVWVDLLLIVLLPLLIGFLVTQLRPLFGILAGAAVVVVYSFVSVLIYAGSLHWVNLIHVDAATLAAALFVALYRVITEGADKRVIREMFGKHVSPALVDEMMKHDDPLKALDLSGKRVKVTIFYSDIRGFTAMSEKMSPEQIYGALNEYFEEMCAIVFEHGGYVDKFIGDCLMAVYSAPNPRPGNTDAYEAVMGAWRQQQRILEMMSTWAADGRPIFTVGMGLNTGEVVMGNLGSSDRLNYTVIGDNVNTAARLYNVALGGQTIISESTYLEVKDHFIVNELTPVFVKGKELPLRNFEVVGVINPGEKNTSTLLDPENMPQPLAAGEH